jgi:hypothetical protein
VLARGVGVQRQEELPVREPRGEQVSGVYGEGRLADPGHPINRMHPCRGRVAAVRPGAVKVADQPIKLGSAAGEAGSVTRQRTHRHDGCRL